MENTAQKNTDQKSRIRIRPPYVLNLDIQRACSAIDNWKIREDSPKATIRETRAAAKSMGEMGRDTLRNLERIEFLMQRRREILVHLRRILISQKALTPPLAHEAIDYFGSLEEATRRVVHIPGLVPKLFGAGQLRLFEAAHAQMENYLNEPMPVSQTAEAGKKTRAAEGEEAGGPMAESIIVMEKKDRPDAKAAAAAPARKTAVKKAGKKETGETFRLISLPLKWQKFVNELATHAQTVSLLAGYESRPLDELEAETGRLLREWQAKKPEWAEFEFHEAIGPELRIFNRKKSEEEWRRTHPNRSPKPR